MWNTIKLTYICIMGVLKGEAKEKGAENIFKKVIVGKSPNVLKNINLTFQKAKQTPSRINAKRSANRHIIEKY